MSIIKLIHKALSDSDIRKILGHDTKIIKYSELSQFEDLSQLLPNLKDYCVILYEDNIDHGHWVGLSRYGGKYEHFDSYGGAGMDQHEEEKVTARRRSLPLQPSEARGVRLQQRQISTVRQRREHLRGTRRA